MVHLALLDIEGKTEAKDFWLLLSISIRIPMSAW